jgi:hypothetical protein
VRLQRFTATNFAAFMPQGIGVTGRHQPSAASQRRIGRKAVAGASMCEQEIGQMGA